MPPGPGYPGQAQLSQQDERMWAMLSHLGGLLIGFIAPLIVLLVQAPKSAFVRRQSVEALNFQITLAIAAAVCAVLFIVLIGFFLMPIVIVGGVVLMIVAGVKTNGGEDYRYPINIRFVK
jgi:uncharacterized Tic20 family protein